jgi:2-polyprenyl-3-methyl-5-hydroxy-6-metoxy-1,4-benzoquinol methylase
VCVACRHAGATLSETIGASDVIAAWRREDQANGATAVLGHRSDEMLSILPERIEFYRCSRCGLQMAQPSTVWPAASYPRDQSYPVRWEFQQCVDDLGSKPLDVLEIGCGTGHFLTAAAARGHRAVGIDFTGPAVAAAQARGARAFCGGFDELGRHVGADARFDVVVCFHVIEHLADPDALLTALAAWTRPNARLFISCPGPRRFTRLIREQQAGASDFWDYPPQHVLRWTLPALRAVAARHGWSVATAMEEPFSWVAAASQIGIAQSTYRQHLHRPLRRRLNIALAWMRLLMNRDRRAGVALYVSATRVEATT